MSRLDALLERLDVRPRERRPFLAAAVGAFLVISFVVVARALREAFFLSRFTIEALPQMAVVTALSAIPAVLSFGRLLSRHDPRRVYRGLLASVAGAAAAGMVAASLPGPAGAVAVLIFYLGTAVGSMLLTTGFWLLVAERFDIRRAKRLFGPIGAGGTLGAMLAGWSIGPLDRATAGLGAPVGLLLTLAALHALERLASPGSPERAEAGPARSVAWRDAHELLRHPHVRAIALVVGCATAASFLIDFQFKAAAARALTEQTALAAFLGRFYGVAGVLALLLQLLVAGPLLRGAGVGATLSVLPSALLAGSAALALLPGVFTATAVRGTDAAIRRSLHRVGIEVLYVPLPTRLRQRAKPIVDSLVDSGAEGIAALVVAVWIGPIGLPVRALALPTAVLAGALLLAARRLDRGYLATILEALRAGQAAIDARRQSFAPDFAGDLATLTIGGLRRRRKRRARASAPSTPPSATVAARTEPPPATESNGESPVSAPPAEPAARLRATDPARVAAALRALAPADALRQRRQIVRLLARDPLHPLAVEALRRAGGAVVTDLREVLLSEESDFVIRRRIPAVLQTIPTAEADAALLHGLRAGRFEVRYRCAAALAHRRRKGLPRAALDDRPLVWRAIRFELARERPVWELQRLLDGRPDRDEFIAGRIYSRGQLSLEHVFRLLSLVLDPEPVRTAFHGIVLDEPGLRALALEYLEQVLPGDVRARLWPFIGDLSEPERRRHRRRLETVVDDLLRTGATLFAGENERRALRRALAADPAGDSDATHAEEQAGGEPPEHGPGTRRP